MGADNLEGWSGGIVSKIRVVLDRFAICVTGCDNTIHAFDGMIKVISDDIELEAGWFDIHEVMSDLVLWTKKYTEQQVIEHALTPEVKRCLNAPQDCEPTVIVFDSKTFELFEVEMKNIYPPQKFDVKSAKKSPLKEGVLHLHAMATNRTLQVSEIPLPLEIFDQPKLELEALINLDKDFHNLARSSQPGTPNIGDLGSFCYFNDGKVIYVNLCSPGSSKESDNIIKK